MATPLADVHTEIFMGVTQTGFGKSDTAVVQRYIKEHSVTSKNTGEKSNAHTGMWGSVVRLSVSAGKLASALDKPLFLLFLISAGIV